MPVPRSCGPATIEDIVEAKIHSLVAFVKARNKRDALKVSRCKGQASSFAETLNIKSGWLELHGRGWFDAKAVAEGGL